MKPPASVEKAAANRTPAVAVGGLPELRSLLPSGELDSARRDPLGALCFSDLLATILTQMPVHTRLNGVKAGLRTAISWALSRQ